jgi:DNA repair exonuclease SbcCD nuclease subunit
MRIAHVSDTHLGYMQYHLRERKEDFFKAFERVIDRVIEEGVDLLVHSGDLFESYHPDVESLSFAISQFTRLKEAGIDVIAITGNHDRALRKGTEPPHKILYQLGLLKLLDPFGELEVKGVYFAGLRYLPKRFLELFREKYFSRFEERAERSGASVFILHQAVDPFISYAGYHPDAYEILASQLPKGFTYYAAGHIHLFRKEELHGGLFSYAGSTEFRSSAEAESGRRGFNIFNVESGKFERVEIEGLRPFLVLKTDGERAFDEFRELLEKVKSLSPPPVVSIVYEDRGEGIEKFSELLKEIEERALYVRLVKRSSAADDDTTGPGGDEGINYPELIKEFCENNRFPEKVGSLAVEITSHSADDVDGIVRDYLKREMGELFSLIEKFGV